MTHPIPEGSIIITPTEVYNEVKSLTDAVRDLISADAQDAQVRAELRLRVDAIDNRLSAVEKKMLLLTGFAAAAGAGAGTWLSRIMGGG